MFSRPTFPRRWEELSWAELQDCPGGVGLVPVGGIEQHGPALPIGTDSIVARAVCAAASERCWSEGVNALVLPPIDIGCQDDAEVVLPGAMSLGAAQLVALATRWTEEAARSGLRRLLFLDAGAGNASALASATDRLGELRPELEVTALPWWSLDERVEEIDAGGSRHAGRAETSLVLAVAPELVRSARAGEGRGATAELGAELLDRTATALAARLAELVLVAAPLEAPALAVPG
ncbi:MAG: creatininase family protein [Acidimicrobiia bacterium]|nr:creatininase family protein [Acidimicrobiia bacterium]